MNRKWAISIALMAGLEIVALFLPSSCALPTTTADHTYWAYLLESSTLFTAMQRATAGLATFPALIVAFVLWLHTQKRARFFHQVLAIVSIPVVVALLLFTWDRDTCASVVMTQFLGVFFLVLFACGLLWHARHAAPGKPDDRVTIDPEELV